LPTNSTSYVQGIGLNQSLQWFSQPMTLGNPSVVWNSSITAPFGLGSNWDYSIFSGDSSNPETFLIGNQLVLVTHNYGIIPGTPIGLGPNYAYQIDAINQQMHYLSTNNAVGTDYQMTPFSMTNWPTIH
jgi:long-subunit fatty acid transport protein